MLIGKQRIKGGGKEEGIYLFAHSSYQWDYWKHWMLRGCIWASVFVNMMETPAHWELDSGQTDQFTKKHSVQFSWSVVSDSAFPWTVARQASLPSPTPRVHPNPCPSSRWRHPAISSSVVPFSSCPQSFSASGSFQMSQLFASGGQSIGISASTSVLPMNTQGWSPGWISLPSKGLSRVFSISTVEKHQFCAQLSL